MSRPATLALNCSSSSLPSLETCASSEGKIAERRRMVEEAGSTGASGTRDAASSSTGCTEGERGGTYEQRHSSPQSGQGIASVGGPEQAARHAAELSFVLVAAGVLPSPIPPRTAVRGDADRPM